MIPKVQFERGMRLIYEAVVQDAYERVMDDLRGPLEPVSYADADPSIPGEFSSGYLADIDVDFDE